ncbi:MAG: hypothetical protein R3Y56_07530 [Akkermansia sp.]
MNAIDSYVEFCADVPEYECKLLEHEALSAACLVMTRDCVIVAVPYDRLCELMDFHQDVLAWDDARSIGGLYVHFAAGDARELMRFGRSCGYEKIIYHRGLKGDRRLHVIKMKGDAR